MTKISSPIDEIKERYDVIVIGSGYGGGIAASRMARAGRKVCLLERGREIVPGEYPNTLDKAVEEFQVHDPSGHIGSRTGMFDLHVNAQQNVLVGCGLGGTSLINANVALTAKPTVLTTRAGRLPCVNIGIPCWRKATPWPARCSARIPTLPTAHVCPSWRQTASPPPS